MAEVEYWYSDDSFIYAQSVLRRAVGQYAGQNSPPGSTPARLNSRPRCAINSPASLIPTDLEANNTGCSPSPGLQRAGSAGVQGWPGV